jgi:hypothetical protein
MWSPTILKVVGLFILIIMNTERYKWLDFEEWTCMNKFEDYLYNKAFRTVRI